MVKIYKQRISFLPYKFREKIMTRKGELFIEIA